MRYIPMSQYSFDEIVEQCRAAINKAPEDSQSDVSYDEILTFYRWEDDVLRLTPQPVAA